MYRKLLQTSASYLRVVPLALTAMTLLSENVQAIKSLTNADLAHVSLTVIKTSSTSDLEVIDYTGHIKSSGPLHWTINMTKAVRQGTPPSQKIPPLTLTYDVTLNNPTSPLKSSSTLICSSEAGPNANGEYVKFRATINNVPGQWKYDSEKSEFERISAASPLKK